MRLYQEKYNLMGIQQPEAEEFLDWDADMNGLVTVAEWLLAAQVERRV